MLICGINRPAVARAFEGSDYGDWTASESNQLMKMLAATRTGEAAQTSARYTKSPTYRPGGADAASSVGYQRSDGAALSRHGARGIAMSRKSVAGKIVRKSAKDIPRSSAADLDRLRAAMRGRIDTSDIPERRPGPRVRRDAN